MDIDTPVSKETCISVPMALGKHLFSFRTQKLSPVAAIILRERETSTVPNYKETIRKGGLFRSMDLMEHTLTIDTVVFFYAKMLLLFICFVPMLKGRNLKTKRCHYMKISVIYESETTTIVVHG